MRFLFTGRTISALLRTSAAADTHYQPAHSMKYLKTFKTQSSARDWMEMKNRACKMAGNTRDIYVMTDGPENDFVVMDLNSAIELGSGYSWS